MGVAERIAELGLELPPEPLMPPHVRITFEWARTMGDRVYLSGHGALDGRGAPAGPFGRVPDQVTLEQAQASARGAGVALIAALQRAVGDLDRVAAWLTVTGFVNAEPGYSQTTAVVNPVSDLLLDVFGDVGRHARTAIGAVALPLDLPVVVAAEVLIER